MTSPYVGVPEDGWKAVTESLTERHPLDMAELVDVAHSCWAAILETRIGGRLKIGEHVFPSPQIMGNFLHEVIPFELAERHPGIWRREEEVDEKDLVYIPDRQFSTEIKTSSSKAKIFGNRSYAQEASSNKKSKSGYYIAINFGKFAKTGEMPGLHRIGFGWLDSTDWVAQKSATGQQASLRPITYATKLLPIYEG